MVFPKLMSLTLRPDSCWWYGKFRLPNAKFDVKNLNVKVEGLRPPTLRKQGDEIFEQTRKLAQDAHDKLLEVMQDKRAGVKFAKAQLELVTAKKHVSPLLAELPDQWALDHRIRIVQEGKIVRFEGELSKSHIKHSRGALARFARFMAQGHVEVKNMAGTTGEQVEQFLNSIQDEKLSARTWNYYLVLLREMFNRHEPDTSACEYLNVTEEKDEDTTHRKPFTDEQLDAIFESAKSDPFIRPIVVTGLNTPLRLSDCCQLLWTDVDLSGKFLTIKRTIKTGEGVQIPIWPQLFDELKNLERRTDFVFPEQAAKYQENPYNINSRLKAVFEAANINFYSVEKAPKHTSTEEVTEETKPGVKSKKRKGKSKSKNQNRQMAPGPRRVNEMAFQAFRTTYVTRALLRGVNEEVLRKATGHTTVDIVRKHYFQPAKEVIRAELDKGRPGLPPGGLERPIDLVQKIIQAMSAKSWRKDRTQLMKLLEDLV